MIERISVDGAEEPPTHSSLETAIVAKLARYLAGEESLDGFKDWLVGATWDVEATHDPRAIDVTYEIKLLLAEQSGGDLSEAELRRELQPLLRRSEAAGAARR